MKPHPCIPLSLHSSLDDDDDDDDSDSSSMLSSSSPCSSPCRKRPFVVIDDDDRVVEEEEPSLKRPCPANEAKRGINVRKFRKHLELYMDEGLFVLDVPALPELRGLLTCYVCQTILPPNWLLKCTTCEGRICQACVVASLHTLRTNDIQCGVCRTTARPKRDTNKLWQSIQIQCRKCEKHIPVAKICDHVETKCVVRSCAAAPACLFCTASTTTETPQDVLDEHQIRCPFITEEMIADCQETMELVDDTVLFADELSSSSSSSRSSSSGSSGSGSSSSSSSVATNPSSMFVALFSSIANALAAPPRGPPTLTTFVRQEQSSVNRQATAVQSANRQPQSVINRQPPLQPAAVAHVRPSTMVIPPRFPTVPSTPLLPPQQQQQQRQQQQPRPAPTTKEAEMQRVARQLYEAQIRRKQREQNSMERLYEKFR